MRYDPEGDLEFQLDTILNGGIEFGDNVRGGFLEIETTGEEQEVQHGLGYTPIGFLVIFKDAECVVWGKQLSNWNNESLFLQSNATNVTVRLFVL